MYRFSVQEYLDANNIPEVEFEELDLSRWDIVDLSGLANIPCIDRVEELYLDHNKLTTIKRNSFCCCPALEHLSLKHNQLVEIEKGSFDQLKPVCGYINLAGNSMIPEAIIAALEQKLSAESIRLILK